MCDIGYTCDALPKGVVKFAGGWFTLISTKLLKLIDIPDELGSYGLDDTYVMYIASVLPAYTHLSASKTRQYVLRNSLVAEDLIYKMDKVYTEMLDIINKQDEYRRTAEEAFPELLQFKLDILQRIEDSNEA